VDKKLLPHIATHWNCEHFFCLCFVTTQREKIVSFFLSVLGFKRLNLSRVTWFALLKQYWRIFMYGPGVSSLLSWASQGRITHDPRSSTFRPHPVSPWITRVVRILILHLNYVACYTNSDENLSRVFIENWWWVSQGCGRFFSFTMATLGFPFDLKPIGRPPISLRTSLQAPGRDHLLTTPTHCIRCLYMELCIDNRFDIHTQQFTHYG